MLRNIILTSLAAASVASAAGCGSTATINAQADLTTVASCTTLASDLTINADNLDLASINLPNLQSIGGDLVITGGNASSISMPLLNAISGNFSMMSLTSLSSVSMGSLTKVGAINWDTLGPQFSALGFAAGIASAGSVVISNTYLQSLTGIMVANTGTYEITNNRYLKSINSPLKTVSTLLNLASNGPSFTAAFPSLIWAEQIKFRDISNVSVPVLSAVNTSCQVDENSITNFIAPKLANIGGTLDFTANPQLTNISMPLLTQVKGGFKIANNTQLTDIDGFPKLKQVVGALDLSGNFENASFPAIEDVEGVFNFQTSAAFDCATFNGYANNQVKGPVHCNSDVTKPTSNDGTSTTDTNGNTGNSTGGSKNAGNSVYSASSAFGSFVMIAMIGAIFV